MHTKVNFDSSLDDHTRNIMSRDLDCQVKLRMNLHVPVYNRNFYLDFAINCSSHLMNLSTELPSYIVSMGQKNLYAPKRKMQRKIIIRSKLGDGTPTKYLSMHPSRPEASQYAHGLYMKRLGVRSHNFHIER